MESAIATLVIMVVPVKPKLSGMGASLYNRSHYVLKEKTAVGHNARTTALTANVSAVTAKLNFASATRVGWELSVTYRIRVR